MTGTFSRTSLGMMVRIEGIKAGVPPNVGNFQHWMWLVVITVPKMWERSHEVHLRRRGQHREGTFWHHRKLHPLSSSITNFTETSLRLSRSVGKFLGSSQRGTKWCIELYEELKIVSSKKSQVILHPLSCHYSTYIDVKESIWCPQHSPNIHEWWCILVYIL